MCRTRPVGHVSAAAAHDRFPADGGLLLLKKLRPILQLVADEPLLRLLHLKLLSLRQKVSTITILWASIGLSIWLMDGKLWVSLLLAAVAVGVSIHILWLKTYRPAIEAAEIHPADEIA